MKSKLTVVMYHYVRNLKSSRFPNIKGLDVEKFRKQVENFSKEYTFVTMEDVIEFYENKKSLPENAILLTFDDGYKDCYTYALPILEEFSAKASFFVPVSNYVNKSLLEVNKIHLLLESVSVYSIITDIEKFIKEYSKSYDNIYDYEYYYEKYAKKSRYDDEDTVFVKRILQKGLPKEFRTKLINILFEKYINVREDVLFEELYLSLDQIKLMKKLGHHIGYHSFNHFWFNELSYEEQLFEFEKPIEFFKLNGIFDENITIAYPYGAYNEETLNLAKKLGIKLAFTVEPRIADLSVDMPLEIPRLDTNDFLK